MILGDLGADVIRVEPPGGSAARRFGPWLDDAPESERSLQFAAFNRNKRSVVLDLDDSADRALFDVLVAGADFVIDSAPDGELDRRGISFAELSGLNDRIVYVVVSPFGIDGPAAARPASDLTLSALGGQAGLQGSPDRAPVRVTVPQIWRHAGAEAAAGALIAHARMLATGQAQLVDLSAQCSATWTMMNAMDAHAIQGFEFERMGSTVQMGTTQVDPVFACSDGHLVALPTGTVLNALLAYVAADDLLTPEWLVEDWETFDLRLASGEETNFDRDDIRALFVRYFALHSKRELFQLGLEAGVTLAPVNTTEDLLSFEQLDARDAWHETRLADGSRARTPGVFARISNTPMELARVAPLLDEHGDEIRAEARDTPRQRADVRPPSGGEDPFAGVKVVDLTWVIAGPASVRYLSDHGAQVIKVESELRPDGLRLLGPLRGEQGWNTSHFYGEFNAGKQCLQLNLKEPAALAILKRLIAWADVLVENWAPGATERLGIHYDACREINPDIIMVSTSLLGQFGPAAQIAGFGYHAGGMAGFYEVTGWPDMPPHGPWMAYTDVIAPHFIAATVAAALDHRSRTGQGQHIDAAQFEMALHFLAPEILDVQANGYVARRLGNRARDAAPQGIYRAAGDDQWCAIAVETDAQWQRLRDVLGNPTWARDAALDTVDGRLAQHDAIDAVLEKWTASRTPHEAMNELCAAGVPAGALQRSGDLHRDPQYLHRGFHRYLEHPVIGRVPYAGNQFRIPGYQGGPRRPSPLLGEHNTEVLGDVLGMDAADIEAAIAAGAIQ